MIDITNNKKYILPIGISALGLLLMFYVAGVMLPKQLITITKASGSSKASSTNSIMIGSKIMATIESDDYCVINVFASDEDGKPVKNSKVVISGIDDVDPKQGVTNEDGKAVFKVKSKNAGTIKVNATVDGINLKNQLSLIFK